MKKTHPVPFRFVKILTVLAALLLFVSAAAAEFDFEPCFRFDSGMNAWQEPLKKIFVSGKNSATAGKAVAYKNMSGITLT